MKAKKAESKKNKNDKKLKHSDHRNISKRKDKKNKSTFNTIEVVVITVISALFGIIVGSILTYNTKTIGLSSSSKELEEITSTYDNIVANYYSKVDKKKLVNGAINGMVSTLDDPYSVYMDSNETETFNTTVDGSYEGIGAVVATDSNSNNYIVSIFSNSPAEKAGLKVGDVFKKVNSIDVSKYNLTDLVKKIKVTSGTKLKLTVLRGDKEIKATLIVGTVELPVVSSKVLDNNIGYINISTFAANSYKQFKKQLNKLEKKKITSLIIDVRDNPGGHLTQVTDILELFMDKKKILYQLETKGLKEKVYSKTSEKRNYKVVVLINSSSASASEILAAAFKESYAKSIIVGTNSYGKGTVQNAYDLSTGSSLKFTTQKWLTPKGNWVNKVGVVPDKVVEESDEYKNSPTVDNDNQLQEAIIELKKES